MSIEHSSKKGRAFDRADLGLALLLGVAALGIYVRTLAQGVLPGDSGEFQVLGYLPAHAHNPGYWVYLLMVKALTMLPVGDAAYRVSLFSALMAAITAACTYLAGKLLSGSRWAGAFGAAALAVCPVFWSQAVIAEVYTAGAAFAAGILVLILAWERTRRSSLLFWAGLLGGLSPGVHGTVGLAAPAVVLMIAFGRPDWRRIWKPALGGALLGAALLLGAFAVVDANPAPYSMINTAYIPARSNFDTSLEELQTPVGRFTFLITSRQWSSAMFQDPWVDTFKMGEDYYHALPKNFAFPVLALMGIGFLSLWWGRPRTAVFFLAAGLAHHLFVFNYRIGDSYAFYLPWFPYACTLAAAGLGWLLRSGERILPRAAVGLRPALGAVLIALALAPFAGQSLAYLQQGEALFEGYSYPSNQERSFWYRDIAATVKALPENAVVFADWYNLYPYDYAAFVEQGRTDLRFFEPTPYSARGGMAETMAAFAVEQAGKGPLLSLNELEPLRAAGLKQSQVLAGPTLFFKYSR